MSLRSNESIIFMSKEGPLRATQVIDLDDDRVVMTELSIPEDKHSEAHESEGRTQEQTNTQRVMAIVAIELAEAERVLRQ